VIESHPVYVFIVWRIQIKLVIICESAVKIRMIKLLGEKQKKVVIDYESVDKKSYTVWCVKLWKAHCGHARTHAHTHTHTHI